MLAMTRLPLRALAAACVLCAALLAAWRRLLFEGLVPLDGNVLCVTFPNWRLARGLWLEGFLPLWNPLRSLGTPHLADPITSALYPPQWLLSGLPDFAAFLRTWVVFHTLLAGFFWAALARRWYGRPGSGLLAPEGAAAALVGTLNAFFMVRVVFPHNFAAAAWVPVILYAQEAGSAAALGAAFALQWFAGYPSFSLITGLACLALALLRGREGLRLFLRAGIIGAGLAAVQLIPFVELLARSSRGVVLDPAYAAQFSLPAWLLLKSLLLPQWYLLSPRMEGDPAMGCFYVGTAAAALAALGAWKGGAREKLLAWTAAACLLISLGSHLPGYRSLFFLHLFRFPSNWLLWASAALALLAAAGVAKIRRPGLAWSLAALIAVDLLVFAQAPKSAWGKPEFLTDVPALARQARLLPPGARVLHAEPLMRLWGRGTLETEEDYLLMRDFLAPSYGMAFGLAEAGNYQTLRLASAQRFRERLSAPDAPEELKDWAGIGLVVDVEAGASKVERGRMRIELRKTAKPRLFAAGEEAQVEVLDCRPGRASARVSSPDSQTLVFAEARYPGWRASVDGKAVPLGEWQGVFMSAEVPAGSHEALFEYRPASFRLGLLVSVLTLAGLLVHAASVVAARRAGRG
ncbi:MAG TPA: hypothetical protein DCM05_04545 [Elusimicrobia bacterium]|nr:hypothetical protein [Elusimicrobiota bacterium]